MTTDHKRLTEFEAVSIVAGLGMGGGIMAVPYLASFNGLLPVILILTAAFAINVLLHLMVVEVVLRDDEPKQLVEVFGKYLFLKGFIGKVLNWLFFGLIVVTFYALLSAYIVGCGDIIHELFGLPLWLGKILTYLICAGVVFFGLKALGLSEKWALIGHLVVLLILVIGAFRVEWNSIPLLHGSWKTGLALFGMIMFSLACFFSVPQAAEGLNWDRRLIPRAVVTGVAINFAGIVIMTIMAMLVSHKVTEIAILGVGLALGAWAMVLGSVFAFLSMLACYWSVSYALAVVLTERLKWNYRLAWLVATSPTLILSIPDLTSFQSAMRYAGGAMAILTAILIVPALAVSRREDKPPDFFLGVWAGPVFQVLIIIAYLVMAVGSVIKYK
jgi:amino acid permease